MGSRGGQAHSTSSVAPLYRQIAGELEEFPINRYGKRKQLHISEMRLRSGRIRNYSPTPSLPHISCAS